MVDWSATVKMMMMVMMMTMNFLIISFLHGCSGPTGVLRPHEAQIQL
jgi:hypothetical protein